jgi:hypothetical protein
MLRRLGIVGATLAVWLTPAAMLEDAAASPLDVASTPA